MIDRIVSIKTTSSNDSTAFRQGKSLPKYPRIGLPKTESNSDQEVIERIRAKAAEEHPNDYSTQKFVMNEQMEAWQQLQNFSDPDISGEVVQSILSKARSDHPNNYSTQLFVVMKRIKDWKDLHR